MPFMSADHIVPTGRLLDGRFPGTAFQAHDPRSLRDGEPFSQQLAKDLSGPGGSTQSNNNIECCNSAAKIRQHLQIMIMHLPGGE